MYYVHLVVLITTFYMIEGFFYPTITQLACVTRFYEICLGPSTPNREGVDLVVDLLETAFLRWAITEIW